VKAMAGVGMPAQLATVVTAADGVTRCRWATETGRDLTIYHDHEWGVPTHHEAMLFETLVLTYFENGLSWATVFDKRDNLRAAFHGFQTGGRGDDDARRRGTTDDRHLHHSKSTEDRSHAAQRSSAVEGLLGAAGMAASTTSAPSTTELG
jgi:DNA-3-methyladenine glycosylase I